MKFEDIQDSTPIIISRNDRSKVEELLKENNIEYKAYTSPYMLMIDSEVSFGYNDYLYDNENNDVINDNILNLIASKLFYNYSDSIIADWVQEEIKDILSKPFIKIY